MSVRTWGTVVNAVAAVAARKMDLNDTILESMKPIELEPELGRCASEMGNRMLLCVSTSSFSHVDWSEMFLCLLRSGPQ